MRIATVPRGAYGLRLETLSSDILVAPVPASWEQVRIDRRPVDGDAPDTTRIDRDVAELAFVSGWSVRVERRPGTATFFMPTPVGDDELLHPHLAPVAMQFAGWLGRDAFHGGAFVVDGGAWAILAGRAGGKSTTLAELAGRAVPVLVDDALVVEGGVALAGPRCIDLRPEAASGLGDGLDEVRRGERRRLELPAIQASAPLRGFFVLEWGDSVRVRALAPAERLLALARHAFPRTASRPSMLELARLPGWLVRRPRRAASLADVCGQLLETALR